MASTRALAHAPWSASKVQTALRCPRLFHYRYVEKVPEPEVMPEALLGKAVHAALENALRGVLVPVAIDEGRKLLGEDDDMDRYEALCAHIPAFVERISLFRRRRRVNRELIEYSVAVRENFSATQFYSGDAFYRGIFDAAYLYGTTLAVVDHKSGERYNNLNNKDQLEGYAVLALAAFKHVRKVWFGIHWLTAEDLEWSQPLSAREINQQLVPRVLANIEAAALAVYDGPRPNPSTWCERCSYRSICPDGRDMRFEPVDPDDFEPFID